MRALAFAFAALPSLLAGPGVRADDCDDVCREASRALGSLIASSVLGENPVKGRPISLDDLFEGLKARHASPSETPTAEDMLAEVRSHFAKPIDGASHEERYGAFLGSRCTAVGSDDARISVAGDDPDSPPLMRPLGDDSLIAEAARLLSAETGRLEDGDHRSQRSPDPTDEVTVSHRRLVRVSASEANGSLLCGAEEVHVRYDPWSTHRFPLRGVIAGWREGLQEMLPGEFARFVIPADKAYGIEGMGKTVGPNETLVYEIALHEIH